MSSSSTLEVNNIRIFTDRFNQTDGINVILRVFYKPHQAEIIILVIIIIIISILFALKHLEEIFKCHKGTF